MCGIVGQFGDWDNDSDAWLTAAVESLRHRGPDDSGTWVDADAAVRLGHRRLAVVDLSAGGHQPFISASGRYVIAFNGEIYNHVELRAQLESLGHRFRTTSDTEVLVEAIEQWGLRGALTRSNAMFAVAVWDRQDRRLGLARDRLGEKPLFVQQHGSAVRFGSELKSLMAGGAPRPTIDRRSLSLYMRLGYVPAPHSIFCDVTKIRPGWIRWLDGAGSSDEQFWTVPSLGHGPVSADATDQLESLLEDAVGLRMVADVPVGAFLSGGIDSSLVTALMAAQTSQVKTFTVGFNQVEFDESVHAERVATHLGTAHTSIHVSDAEARAVVPSLSEMFDEPFADQSAIPTSIVCGLARSSVTVALSGDGGDELFGGYTRYRRIQRAAPLAAVPSAAGRVLSSSAALVGARVPALAARARTVERIGLGVQGDGVRGLYESIVSLWEEPDRIVIGEGGHHYALDPDCTDGDCTDGDCGSWPRDDIVRSAMGADLVTYLPDDILVKLDRTSMAVALESRIPLLDPRVVEWARCHARPSVDADAVVKAPLRRILGRHVPNELFERPKMGFGAPVGEWLRGPLRAWADDLLDVSALEAGGLLRAEPIRRRWTAHQSGRVDYSFPLWAVLMFQAWRRRWEI